MDAKEHGREFHRFQSRVELRKYTVGSDKRFPLGSAKENLFLKWMLIKLVPDKKSGEKTDATAKQQADVEEAGAHQPDTPVHQGEHAEANAAPATAEE